MANAVHRLQSGKKLLAVGAALASVLIVILEIIHAGLAEVLKVG
jgi:hypothetical protein